METLYSEEKGKLKNAIQRIRRLESDIVEITSIEHDNIDNVHKPSVINKLELEKTGLTKDLFETKKALRQCQERIISLETTHRTYEESLFKQKRINSDTNDNMIIIIIIIIVIVLFLFLKIATIMGIAIKIY